MPLSGLVYGQEVPVTLAGHGIDRIPCRDCFGRMGNSDDIHESQSSELRLWKNTGQSNQQTTNEDETFLSSLTSTSQYLKPPRYNRFKFDSHCNQLVGRKDVVIFDWLQNANENSVLEHMVNTSTRKASDKVHELVLNPSLYKARLAKPRPKELPPLKKKIVASEYAKYFSLSNQARAKSWPRRLVVKGNIDFKFMTYESKAQRNAVRRHKNRHGRVENSDLSCRNLLARGAQNGGHDDEMVEQRIDAENISIDKCFGDTTQPWKSYSSMPKRVESLERNCSLRTRKQNTYHGIEMLFRHHWRAVFVCDKSLSQC